MTWEVIVRLHRNVDDGGMRTNHASTRPAAAEDPADPVRRVLVIDAGICALSGGILLAAAVPIARSADLAAPTIVWVLGTFLLLLGLELAVLSRAPTRWARLGAVVTGMGDLVWVGGSVAVVATAGLPGWATAAVLAQAAVVLAVAGAKRVALSRPHPARSAP